LGVRDESKFRLDFWTEYENPKNLGQKLRGTLVDNEFPRIEGFDWEDIACIKDLKSVAPTNHSP
jgi:hypothetical protein